MTRNTIPKAKLACRIEAVVNRHGQSVLAARKVPEKPSPTLPLYSGPDVRIDVFGFSSEAATPQPLRIV